MLRTLALLIVLLSSALFAASCGDDDGDVDDVTPTESATSSEDASPSPTEVELDEVSFMAGFKPQANLPFVGVYVAKEKGFFEEEGLDVDVLHVNSPGDNFPLLAAGQIQFSTADATALLEKWTGDPQLPIVSIALIGQTGQQGFAVLADSGIATPADWAGKTAGYKGSAVPPDYLAILEANGVERGSVEEVRVGFEPQVLTEGLVDVFPVFIANEPDTLSRLGYETTVFTAADYGAPTLGLTYVAMEDYVAENADITERFVRAALRGIEYADANREEALDIILRYAPAEDREHQRYMLETELEMARAGGVTQVGSQTLEQWQALHDYLVEYAAIPQPVENIARVFSDEFVE
jgi:ABC-type nitrate/sulfonate/bicarbonate transport system substrate-binding protein